MLHKRDGKARQTAANCDNRAGAQTLASAASPDEYLARVKFAISTSGVGV
jgi:hypothetical protein